MTELKQVYKCNICGNIAEVLHIGAGELVCCGQPMELLKEKTGGEGAEKHIPIIEGNKVSAPHLMDPNHYIEWIEVDNCRKSFSPGDEPVAEFNSPQKARLYCNIHGLWTN